MTDELEVTRTEVTYALGSLVEKDRPPLGDEWIGRALRTLDCLLSSRTSGEELQPMETAPRDGSEIVLRTRIGEVSARYHPGDGWMETMDGREYDGPAWICYDDAFQIEIEETPLGELCAATGWRPLSPPGTDPISHEYKTWTGTVADMRAETAARTASNPLIEALTLIRDRALYSTRDSWVDDGPAIHSIAHTALRDVGILSKDET